MKEMNQTVLTSREVIKPRQTSTQWLVKWKNRLPDDKIWEEGFVVDYKTMKGCVWLHGVTIAMAATLLLTNGKTCNTNPGNESMTGMVEALLEKTPLTSRK